MRFKLTASRDGMGPISMPRSELANPHNQRIGRSSASAEIRPAPEFLAQEHQNFFRRSGAEEYVVQAVLLAENYHAVFFAMFEVGKTFLGINMMNVRPFIFFQTSSVCPEITS